MAAVGVPTASPSTIPLDVSWSSYLPNNESPCKSTRSNKITEVQAYHMYQRKLLYVHLRAWFSNFYTQLITQNWNNLFQPMLSIMNRIEMKTRIQDAINISQPYLSTAENAKNFIRVCYPKIVGGYSFNCYTELTGTVFSDDIDIKFCCNITYEIYENNKDKYFPLIVTIRLFRLYVIYNTILYMTSKGYTVVEIPKLLSGIIDNLVQPDYKVFELCSVNVKVCNTDFGLIDSTIVFKYDTSKMSPMARNIMFNFNIRKLLQQGKETTINEAKDLLEASDNDPFIASFSFVLFDTIRMILNGKYFGTHGIRRNDVAKFSKYVYKLFCLLAVYEPYKYGEQAMKQKLDKIYLVLNKLDTSQTAEEKKAVYTEAIKHIVLGDSYLFSLFTAAETALGIPATRGGSKKLLNLPDPYENELLNMNKDKTLTDDVEQLLYGHIEGGHAVDKRNRKQHQPKAKR
jgi:hypothetical protein